MIVKMKMNKFNKIITKILIIIFICQLKYQINTHRWNKKLFI